MYLPFLSRFSIHPLPFLPCFLVIFACKDGEAQKTECTDHGDCTPGEGCRNGTCGAVDCLQDDQCSFGMICSMSSYSCLDGCHDDEDCDAGEYCDEEAVACVTALCTDTQVDCALGELCDLDSGVCEPATGPFCSPECDPDVVGVCGADAWCPPLDRSMRSYCLPNCVNVEGAICPAGSVCIGDPEQPDPHCFAPCPELIDLGVLPDPS